MKRRRDQDLAQCVSVGGWVRGTEIITSIIGRDFTAKKSEILYQPQLLEHFTTTFKENRRFQRDPRMKTIIRRLEQLQPFMARDGAITQNQVKRIHGICAQLGKETISP